MILNIFDTLNYLLEGTEYLSEGEYITRVILDIDGYATYHTNKGNVISSEDIENL